MAIFAYMGFAPIALFNANAATRYPPTLIEKHPYNPTSLCFSQDTEGLFKPYHLRASDIALWSPLGHILSHLFIGIRVDVPFSLISYTIEECSVSALFEMLVGSVHP